MERCGCDLQEAAALLEKMWSTPLGEVEDGTIEGPASAAFDGPAAVAATVGGRLAPALDDRIEGVMVGAEGG